ncbi:hypothetical protein GE21DRAFT_1017795 [Neurospora crassa]|nr:hypothetical protein GE21DRAFT_1017795 [Neurospora crassa]
MMVLPPVKYSGHHIRRGKATNRSGKVQDYLCNQVGRSLAHDLHYIGQKNLRTNVVYPVRTCLLHSASGGVKNSLHTLWVWFGKGVSGLFSHHLRLFLRLTRSRSFEIPLFCLFPINQVDWIAIYDRSCFDITVCCQEKKIQSRFVLFDRSRLFRMIISVE